MEWDREAGRPAGWEEDEPAARGLRYRHDGFTPDKQKKFLKWLGRTGCISDAARKAGISRVTVGRTRGKFPDFEEKVQAALALAVPKLEAIAYQRATVGTQTRVIRKGKLVEIRQKPSDAMLRLLLAGAAPRKYGRMTGYAQMEKEIRAKLDKKRRGPKVASNEDVIEALAQRLAQFGARAMAAKAAAREAEARGQEAEAPPRMRLVSEAELLRLGWRPPEAPEGHAGGA